jgi:hypothetical protein
LDSNNTVKLKTTIWLNQPCNNEPLNSDLYSSNDNLTIADSFFKILINLYLCTIIL